MEGWIGPVVLVEVGVAGVQRGARVQHIGEQRTGAERLAGLELWETEIDGKPHSSRDSEGTRRVAPSAANSEKLESGCQAF